MVGVLADFRRFSILGDLSAFICLMVLRYVFWIWRACRVVSVRFCGIPSILVRFGVPGSVSGLAHFFWVPGCNVGAGVCVVAVAGRAVWGGRVVGRCAGARFPAGSAGAGARVGKGGSEDSP